MERENDIVICPYDSHHIIHSSRIQRHLMKCSRNYPPEYKTTCPYNATHLIFKDDFLNHMQQCQDRKYLNPERFTFALKNHGSIKSCPPSEAESAIFDETWDEPESEAVTNDEESVVSNPVSIPPPILPILPKPRIGPCRQPRSRSEAVMLEMPADECVIDDNESVISAVSGAGRGMKFAQKVRHLAMLNCRRPPVTYDMAKIGISAITDVSDVESVISERGCGRGTIRMRYN